MYTEPALVLGGIQETCMVARLVMQGLQSVLEMHSLPSKRQFLCSLGESSETLTS